MSADRRAFTSLQHGDRWPFDASDVWKKGKGDHPPPPVDWAHRAVRGVVADLTGRSGMDVFGGVDELTRVALAESLAAIIRLAHVLGGGK